MGEVSHRAVETLVNFKYYQRHSRYFIVLPLSGEILEISFQVIFLSQI